MAYKGHDSPTRPVPGGKSFKGDGRKSFGPVGGGSLNVGRGRGLVGSGNADKHGRTAAQLDSNAPGNYGGGYAYKDGKIPPSAKKRG